uniref:Thioredoxin domain-containing protein n=1 Tax=Fibrocapsa japonica TaxID=94617 RepID=A0A7S2UY08_9STRA|mmetsp:Transcript_14487/g.21316  ORF Transcript_14487/g.21316 Transcript_14487/m.21316 type:complete len:416 (+) Transcript_14487:78-1325(+)
MVFQDLLGSELKKGNQTIPTAELDGKIVGLYFSAHWCPPCKMFTPQLAQWYNKFNSEKPGEFEVVFVSSDKSDAQFNEYFEEMPWCAIPFEKDDLRRALGRKFKCQGIPFFVILDSNGEMVTDNGREGVMEEPNSFPWHPVPITELLGSEFIGAGGTTTTPDLSGKTLGIYFSAHWCPPCRGFTPKLVDFYNNMKSKRDDFEIIFVSRDREQSQFDEYFGEMPWLAVPYTSASRDKLAKSMGVRGIPSFQILDADRKVINKDARMRVENDLQGEGFPWPPQPLEDLSVDTTCMGYDINDVPALIVFMEGADDMDQQTLTTGLNEIATKYAEAGKEKGKEQTLLFFTAKASNRITSQIQSLCGIQPGADVTAVIVNCPEGGCHKWSGGDEVTADSIKDFVAKFESGEIPVTPFSRG